MSWRRLRVLIRQLPAESALTRSEHGEAAEWTISVVLAAAEVNALREANWQRSGGKRAQRPKPILPPWEEAKAPTSGLTPAETFARLKAQQQRKG